jgi:hypothetical protein
MIVVSVKIIDNIYKYEVHPYDCIYSLKVKIFDEHKFNIKNIILEYNGKILTDSVPIYEYNITNNINLDLKLNGGRVLGLTKSQQHIILTIIKKIFIIIIVIFYFVSLIGGFTPIFTNWLQLSLKNAITINIIVKFDNYINRLRKTKPAYITAILKVFQLIIKYIFKLIMFLLSFIYIGFIYIFTSFVVYIVSYDISEDHFRSVRIAESTSKITAVTYGIAYGILQLSIFTVLANLTMKFPTCFDTIMEPLRLIFRKLEPMFGPKLLRSYPYIPVLAFRNPFSVLGGFTADFVNMIYADGAKYERNVIQANGRGFYKYDYTLRNKYINLGLWNIWKFMVKYGSDQEEDVLVYTLDGNFAGIIALFGLIFGVVVSLAKEASKN